jgi:hypothetical protein
MDGDKSRFVCSAACVAISDAVPSVKAGAELQMPTRVTRFQMAVRGARDQPRHWGAVVL